MGIYLAKLLPSIWWGNKTYKILMTGLDSAGIWDLFYFSLQPPSGNHYTTRISFSTANPKLSFESGLWYREDNNSLSVKTRSRGSDYTNNWPCCRNYWVRQSQLNSVWSGWLDKPTVLELLSPWSSGKPSSKYIILAYVKTFASVACLWCGLYGLFCQGLIFVVDLNDKNRIHEARDKLHNILGDDTSCANLLVFANKQELAGAMSIPEVTAALDLQKVQNRKYFVQGCSARRGEGLLEGLEWLASDIGQKL